MQSIKIGGIEAPPFATSCAFDTVCPQRGYAVDVTLDVCEFLHANCIFHWFNGTTFGDYNESTGKVSGLLGAIASGEFDVSIPIFSPTYRRSKAVYFSDTFFFFKLIMATRAPPSVPEEFDLSILRSLEISSWFLLLMAFLLTSLVITAILKIRHMTNRSWICAWIDTTLSLIQGELSWTLDEYSVIKPMRFCWEIASLIFTTLATAFLCSQNVVPFNQVPYTDVESLIECLSNYKCQLISSNPGSSFLLYITSPESPLSPRVKEILDRNPVLIVPEHEIPGRIVAGKDKYFVWPIASTTFYYRAREFESSKFYVVEAPFLRYGSFPMNKNSTLKAKFNRMAAYFRDFGLSAAMRARYERPLIDSNQAIMMRQDSNSVGILGIKASLELYSVGITFGFVIFMIELGVHTLRKAYIL